MKHVTNIGVRGQVLRYPEFLPAGDRFPEVRPAEGEIAVCYAGETPLLRAGWLVGKPEAVEAKLSAIAAIAAALPRCCNG